MSIKDILMGWGNLIIRPEHITPLMEKRIKICNECPIRTNDTCDKKKGGCGCYIPAKNRSNSKCPKGKW